MGYGGTLVAEGTRENGAGQESRMSGELRRGQKGSQRVVAGSPFGAWVLGRIEAKNWNIQTAAAETGLTFSTIYKWIRMAGPDPRASTIAAFADVFGVQRIVLYCLLGMVERDIMEKLPLPDDARAILGLDGPPTWPSDSPPSPKRG